MSYPSCECKTCLREEVYRLTRERDELLKAAREAYVEISQGPNPSMEVCDMLLTAVANAERSE